MKLEKKMKKNLIYIFLLAALALTACGGQAAQPAQAPAVQEPAAEVPAEMPAEAPAALPEEAPAEAEAAIPEPAEQTVSSGLIDYTATEDLFALKVPGSWASQQDTTTIEKTVVDTFTAPDGNAFVQVLTNRVDYELDKVLKGQVTLDYMKRLYGKDLRVATDVTLPDGRERLDWWSESSKTSGSTYFEMENRYLFFYTIARKDKYKDQYDPILKEVADSYTLIEY
jgi:hypothetical protein